MALLIKFMKISGEKVIMLFAIPVIDYDTVNYAFITDLKY